jgi:hypothetical protein
MLAMETSARVRMVRWAVLAAVSGTALIWASGLAPIPQPQAYHGYADARTILGIPHFWNVVSNLPFAVIGLFGCWWLTRVGRVHLFDAPSERRAYLLFYFAELLTCFGSAYYHAWPASTTLVWDRLVFSLMLTSFFAMIIAEFVNTRAGTAVLAPLAVAGVTSVLYWHWTETMGRGDLRPYVVIQFYPMLVMPLILWMFPSRYPRPDLLFAAWLLYGVAKYCEIQDHAIYELTGLWSGHTLKHLVAAGASVLPLARLGTLEKSEGRSQKAEVRNDLASAI